MVNLVMSRLLKYLKVSFNKTSDCADSLSVDDISIHSYVDVIWGNGYLV